MMKDLSDKKNVEVKSMTDDKIEPLEGLKEAIKEVNLIVQGKIKGIPGKDLLEEL